ncbi:unnamed protein product [Nippostrongylus brasiliensis]|uniref:BZIP domain-containing protein n=1 Tax=Nippostrongylus brasiliensis TaxID=27835 RepID=A0A0N4YIP2_NIPBR|nr:unnamed protein product [Nippostrongylus brasiliensis]
MQTLNALMPIVVIRAPAEPAPRRSEADQQHEKEDATKSELAKDRKDTKKMAAKFEEKEAERLGNEPLESLTRDELKEECSRLHARDAALKREVCGLKRRIRNVAKDGRRH